MTRLPMTGGIIAHSSSDTDLPMALCDRRAFTAQTASPQTSRTNITENAIRMRSSSSKETLIRAA